MQLHEGADHRVESRDARGVQVRVVLHEACGEVEQGRERVEKHGEDDERDRADAARMGAGHVEREHRRIVETLEELDVRGAPAREPAEDVGDGDVDEEAEHAVEVAHVCGLVGGERDDLVLPEQVRDVREDDDAAPEAPAREHDVGVVPGGGAGHDDHFGHGDALTVQALPNGLAGFGVRIGAAPALPEDAVDARELPAPEEIDEPDAPCELPPVAARVFEDGEKRGGDGHEDEPAPEGL